MKIKLTELKKALAWVEQNSADVILNVSIDENRESYLKIQCKDRYEVFVEIKVFHDGLMLPKIIKESNLP